MSDEISDERPECANLMPAWVDNALDELKEREKQAEAFFERLDASAKADPDGTVIFTIHKPPTEAGDTA